MKDEAFHYWQCGLDYVWLTGGVEWTENEYGRFYKIQEVDKLHALLAHEIVSSPHPLRGQELRFLRSYMDMSQECLAGIMGVTRGAIAKNEKEPNKKLSGQTDRLLRLIYLMHKNDYEAYKGMADLLDDIAEKDYQKELSLCHKGHIWKIAA